MNRRNTKPSRKTNPTRKTPTYNARKAYVYPISIAMLALFVGIVIYSLFVTVPTASSTPIRPNHPIAVYHDDNGFKVYAIDPSTGTGTRALRIHTFDIQDMGIPAQKSLLGEAENPFTGEMIRVYRLNNGGFQASTNDAHQKPFQIQWNANGVVVQP